MPAFNLQFSTTPHTKAKKASDGDYATAHRRAIRFGIASRSILLLIYYIQHYAGTYSNVVLVQVTRTKHGVVKIRTRYGFVKMHREYWGVFCCR